MSLTLEERIRRAEEVLAKVADGDLDQRLDTTGEEDAFASLEMGINFLLVDLRQSDAANRKQRDSLILKQKELENKLLTIEQQASAIRQLSAPVIEVWDDILVLPIVGNVDAARGVQIMESLLSNITEKKARCVILDITGVDVVDTGTADYLLRVVRSAGMLGARCVVTGVSPNVAVTLIQIGADLSEIRTLRSLKIGLLECMRYLNKDIDL